MASVEYVEKSRLDEAEARLKIAREALEQSREGWENAIELRLIPERHHLTARILAGKCAAALKLMEERDGST